MKALLIIIGILASFSLFSQIAEKKQYPFPTYCYQGLGNLNFINVNLNTLNLYNDGEIEFTYKKYGNSSGAYHPIISRFNASVKGYQIFISNSNNKLNLYTDAVHTFDYVVDANIHTYNLEFTNDSCILTVDGIEQQIITGIIYYNIPTATANQIGKYGTNSINGALSKFKAVINDIITTEYPLCESYNDTAYDVSDYNNNGVLGGTIATSWTKCSQQTYPETNGVSKHNYKGHAVYVPWLLSGQPISTTAINAAETVINYSFTLWGKTYLVK